MVDLSDVQAYSRRTGVDNRGFVFLSDKQGADEWPCSRFHVSFSFLSVLCVSLVDGPVQ